MELKQDWYSLDGVSESSREKPTEAVLIVNGQSRRGREWFPLVKDALTQTDINVRKATLVRKPGEISNMVKEAVAAKTPLVIVGGGDGTFSTVARHFIGKESVLGVLPLGTGNAFARDLGIEAKVTEACLVLGSGMPTAVDIGTVQDDFFLNVATIGLTTLIAQNLTNEAKKRLGRMVYLFALFRGLARVKPFKVEIEWPDGKSEFESLQVVIGNGRFHAGPFPIAPEASITDNRLSIYALTGTNKAEFIRLALRLRKGTHVDLDDVFHIETTSGSLKTTPQRKVTVDGEIEFQTPIKFGVAAKALRVMVPIDFKG